MISFTCTGCGKLFSVPDDCAGRSARCKACGTTLQVPTASTIQRPTVVAPTHPSPGAPSAKMPVRMRRLIADAAQMRTRFEQSPIYQLLRADGEAPELYQVKFNVRSIERLDRNAPVFRDEHIAEIQLTADYPRLAPKCRLTTPIFHPNIDTATICVGDHWAAGERLSDLVIRIAEILAFQAYNIKSPLNGEAAMWADLHGEQLPTDARNLQIDVA